MDLSIIIVSYNSRYFLEQCLHSVKQSVAALRAMQREAEVLVIDNHSSDDSLNYLRPLFPDIRFLDNPVNEGFAKANNRALQEARGDFILFLNPDTILAENSLPAAFDCLAADPTIGAVGLRMIDGTGQFLPESKRGFPWPWVAFCKMSGLSLVFPRSRFFSRYYQGWLDKEQPADVDVLSGAFFMTRRSILQQTGGFDERYFLYGEDIDLSYQIRQLGYRNRYLGQSAIIHFKGESSGNDPDYLDHFYGAMTIFIRKYRDQVGSAPGRILLHWGIWCKKKFAGLKPHRQQKNNNAPTIDLTGDPQTIAVLQPGLHGVFFKAANSRILLFCQGDHFSFQQIILSMQLPKTGTSYRIHSAGSQSIVGSDSKEEPGQAIPLPG